MKCLLLWADVIRNETKVPIRRHKWQYLFTLKIFKNKPKLLHFNERLTNSVKQAIFFICQVFIIFITMMTLDQFSGVSQLKTKFLLCTFISVVFFVRLLLTCTWADIFGNGIYCYSSWIFGYFIQHCNFLQKITHTLNFPNTA